MIKDYEIYLIFGPGCWYVGSTTIGAPIRFERHLSGKGGAKKLYAKIQELGPEVFHQVVVETDHGDPIEAEGIWYDWYITHDARETMNGRRPGTWDGHDNTGRVYSEATLQKMSESHKGKPGHPHTVASRAKIAESNRRRTVTQETKDRIRRATAERMQDPERRVAAGKVLNTPEAREKARLGRLGKRHPHTVESRANLSRALKGREITWRDKLSENYVPAAQVRCGDCEMITRPGPLKLHHKSSGHSSMRPVEDPFQGD